MEIYNTTNKDVFLSRQTTSTYYTVPAWSLGIVFVLTILLTLTAAGIALRIKKRKERRKFKKNSGRIVIGNRGRRGQSNAYAKPRNNNTYVVRADVPGIRFSKDNSSSNLHQNGQDRVNIASAQRPSLGKLEVRPVTSASENDVSMASGVYANVDISRTDHTANPTQVLKNEEGSLHPEQNAKDNSIFNTTESFIESSYFTPVLRTQSQVNRISSEAPQQPTFLDFARRFRQQLLSSVSDVGNSFTNALTSRGRHSTTECDREQTERPKDIDSEASAPVSHWNQEKEDQENTYLSFSNNSPIPVQK